MTKRTQAQKIAMLQPFCTQLYSRYDLSAPFVKRRHVYATDGSVCVRVPYQASDSIGNFPPACKVFADFPRGPFTRTMPTLPDAVGPTGKKRGLRLWTAWFAVSKLVQIATLPDVRIGRPYKCSETDWSFLPFTFAGGQGLLCALDWDVTDRTWEAAP